MPPVGPRFAPTARKFLAAGLCALAMPAAAHAAVSPSLGGFESGTFSEFSQTGVTSGTLGVASDKAYEGARAAKATYDGSGSNGYARTIQNVSWAGDADVWYGAAFFLPSGYKASLKGGNDILRWDNYGALGSGADYGGVEFHSDGRARIMLGKYTNDPGTVVVQPFDLPEGRWFYLEVHQRFSTSAGSALTDVYVDGARIAGSTAANSYGRTVDRIRTGIVSISDGRQTTPLSLWFDRVSVSTSQRGPLGVPTTTTDTTTTDPTTTTTTTTGTTTTGTTTTPPPTTTTPTTTPPSTTATTVGGRLASLEDGTFAEFDSVNASNGRAAVSTALAYNGTRSMKLTKNRGGGGGYARGVFTTSVPDGSDVWYGGAYYLPTTFKSSLQGGVDILRWDNWGAYGDSADYGGIRISASDRKARLLLGRYVNDPATQLGASFDLPSGRWFWLEVHQRFSASSGAALSEVYIDGRKVSASTSANSYGRSIDRVRSGIVSTHDSRQTKALEMWVDRASISATERGPLTAVTATSARKRTERVAARRAAAGRAAARRAAARRAAARRAAARRGRS